MGEIQELTTLWLAFGEERDWHKYYTPKELAISLAIEAAEVLEHVQWKTPEEIQEALADEKRREVLQDELSDVATYLFGLAHVSGIDLREAVVKKLQKLKEKYPVNEIKGKHTNKY